MGRQGFVCGCRGKKGMRLLSGERDAFFFCGVYWGITGAWRREIAMGEKGSHQFFQNRECEYFPCHKGVDPADFNCLFCYCPLYALGKKCGGNYRYNEKGNKVCADCAFPHCRDNYDAVLSRYGEIMAAVKRMDGEAP
ncbi:MAG: hypothetical protein E7324_09285 [Clostridiales bacterium]|nr:hypothetical protein [Clostridiales bacterium]